MLIGEQRVFVRVVASCDGEVDVEAPNAETD